MGKTKVIAIEGIDGSGKSVQYNKLAEALTDMGYSVEKREYPKYESYFGSHVGSYLSGAEGVKADAVDGKSMALWFALDRWEDMRSHIDGEYDYMIINRYVLSNAVYQSIRDIDLQRPDIIDWVFELEYGHFCLPKADIYLFYDVAPAQAGENVMKKGFRDYVGGEKKDVYEESCGIQQRARAKYLETAERRNDIAVIQCMGDEGMRSIEDIAAETMRVLPEKNMIGTTGREYRPQSVKKVANRHFFELFRVLPLTFVLGRQNPQGAKTSGFSSVLTHMSSEPD